MSQFPQMPFGPQRPVIMRPREPRRRRRFRWWLVTIPAAILAIAWVVRHIEPVANFDRLIRPIHLAVPERFRMLVMLGTVAVAICLIARVLRKPKTEEEDR